MVDLRRWIVAVTLLLVVPGWGQSLSDRISHVRKQQQAQAAQESAEAQALAQQIADGMRRPMSMQLRGVPLRDAFEQWSRQSGVPLVIDWRAMALDGVDESVPIDLEMIDVRADTLLLYLMDGASQDLRFVAEVQPWGVQLRSRERASRDVMTRVYDVRDLLVDVPHFDDAPSMDLRDALSNTRSGGGGSEGGSSSGVFRIDDFSDKERPLTKQERGDLLVELVRESIESDLWRANGGEHSSIRYRGGLLIVRAPLYVHMQIGRPAGRSGGVNSK